MSIDELTVGEVKKALAIAREFDDIKAKATTISHSVICDSAHPWNIGQNYHIRTVTHYWTGTLVDVTDQELVLDEATWIPSTGRFSNFFENGPDEAEPVDGLVIIGRGAIVDAQEFCIALPRSQK